MRKKKIVVFDENSRREFVTGFRKRKLARKNKATEEFERQLKEAKKKVKGEVRNTYKKIIQPVQTSIATFDSNENEYELSEHIVKVKELLPDEIAEQNNWIGRNRMKIESKDNNEEIHSNVTSEDDEPIPGMSVTSLKQVRKIVNNKASTLMQNDKIFKMKNKLERLKNRKKAARKRNLLKKEQKKLKGRKRK